MGDKISIVIPCRNEAGYIGKCLDSILASDYPKEDLQVMVCDGESDDGTIEIIQEYSRKHGFIHYVNNPKRLTPFAMNLGIRHLPCEYVLIMGAHSTIDANYIRTCKKIIDGDDKIGCVGGVLRNIFENEGAEAIGLAMSSSFGVGSSYFRTGMKEGEVDTVGTPFYRMKTLNEVGLFNEVLARNQDDELNYRVRKAGYRIYLTLETGFDYYVRASMQKLFKQYYQYGYWKVYVNRMHGTVTTIRQLIPAGFIVSLVSSLILSVFFPPCLYAFFLILVLYTGAAFWFANKLAKGKMMGEVVTAFLNLHFGYGSGYLKGIYHFLILRKEPARSQTQLSR